MRNINIYTSRNVHHTLFVTFITTDCNIFLVYSAGPGHRPSRLVSGQPVSGPSKNGPILGPAGLKCYSIDMIFCILNYIYFDTSK